MQDDKKELTFYKAFVIMYAFSVASNAVERIKSRRSAVGSALRSGRKGRGFESRRLDQNSTVIMIRKRIANAVLVFLLKIPDL